jgi:hypothetical protein
MQTEAQKNLPLKEASAGEPYRVSGAAALADNLIDVSRHCTVGFFFRVILLHKQYALNGGVLAILFGETAAGDGFWLLDPPLKSLSG